MHQNLGIGSSCLGHTNIERRGLSVKEESERRKLGGSGQSRKPESAGVQGEESDVWWFSGPWCDEVRIPGEGCGAYGYRNVGCHSMPVGAW